LEGAPVMVLTTKSHDNEKQDAKAAGEGGWLVKLFHSGKLTEIIARALP
jgi:hypothetical protein